MEIPKPGMTILILRRGPGAYYALKTKLWVLYLPTLNMQYRVMINSVIMELDCNKYITFDTCSLPNITVVKTASTKRAKTKASDYFLASM